MNPEESGVDNLMLLKIVSPESLSTKTISRK